MNINEIIYLENVMSENKNILIVSTIEQSPGWMPINHMIDLAADTLDCEIIQTKSNLLSKIEQFKLHFSSRKKNTTKPDVLIVVATASELSEITTLPNWNKSFNRDPVVSKISNIKFNRQIIYYQW